MQSTWKSILHLQMIWCRMSAYTILIKTNCFYIDIYIYIWLECQSVKILEGLISWSIISLLWKEQSSNVITEGICDHLQSPFTLAFIIRADFLFTSACGYAIVRIPVNWSEANHQPDRLTGRNETEMEVKELYFIDKHRYLTMKLW